MVREITPAKTWLWALTAYMTGLVISATAVGATAGWLGAFLQATVLFNLGNNLWLAFLGIIATLYGLHEVGIVRLPMPQINWLVPVTWSRYGKIGQALLYGIVLGAEIFTFVPYPSFYIILLLEMSLGIQGGAMLGLTYGLARILPTFISTLYARIAQQDVNCITARILYHMPTLHLVSGLILLVVGEILIGRLLFGS